MLVSERVDKVLREQLGTGFSWTAETPLQKGGLDLDSLDIVELVMRLEEEFRIEIPDEDIYTGEAFHLSHRFHTVGDVVATVERLSAAKQALFA